MKILAIMGSPRKSSNVDILIDKVLEGAKSKTDVEVEKVYIYESDIKYCTGCGAHSILQGAKDCPLGDDMDGIMERMQQPAEIIFFEICILLFSSRMDGRTIQISSLQISIDPFLKKNSIN